MTVEYYQTLFTIRKTTWGVGNGETICMAHYLYRNRHYSLKSGILSTGSYNLTKLKLQVIALHSLRPSHWLYLTSKVFKMKCHLRVVYT
jgi:hypothetical protein